MCISFSVVLVYSCGLLSVVVVGAGRIRGRNRRRIFRHLRRYQSLRGHESSEMIDALHLTKTSTPISS